jgi:hypothetical protein
MKEYTNKKMAQRTSHNEEENPELSFQHESKGHRDLKMVNITLSKKADAPTSPPPQTHTQHNFIKQRKRETGSNFLAQNKGT